MWNDPDIGITWPTLIKKSIESSSKELYMMSDGTIVNLSEKDKKWQGIKEVFKF